LLEIVNRHPLSYVLVQVTANAPLVRVKLVRVTDNPQGETQTRTRTRTHVNVAWQAESIVSQCVLAFY